MNQSAGLALEIQPLPAYQHFENIRNFLVAVEELNLPSFEASDLERVYNNLVVNLLFIWFFEFSYVEFKVVILDLIA